MRTRTKIWLITAVSFVLLGCILFIGVMTTLEWDFMKLATVYYETNTYDIDEPFSSISMSTDTANIVFAFAEDGKCKVECYEEMKVNHSVTVENGTLIIKLIDERTMYDFVEQAGLNFDTSQIIVYLPKNEYASLLIEESTGDILIPKDFVFNNVDVSLSTGDVTFNASASETIVIKTSTGDINVENISAGTLDVTVSTGKVTLTNITCKNVISKGNTGDLQLVKVIAEENFTLSRSTGKITFQQCDAANISATCSTGDVTGSFLTEKVFMVESNTGDVTVPNTITGGKCEIKTNTGDVNLSIKTNS